MSQQSNPNTPPKRSLPFVDVPRVAMNKRKPEERLQDSLEFESPLEGEPLAAQASRCMSCGIPFCHNACPLGNFIPEWNRLVTLGLHDAAIERLHATNNFPEFTGRLCPAPCEASCVLSISGAPVSIKQVELALANRIQAEPPKPRREAHESAAPEPREETSTSPPPSAPPPSSTVRRLKRIAVIGSGPAGLACASELASWGYSVTVFERDDRPGGLLRYGIPDFKMAKSILDRRIDQMAVAGVQFQCGVHVGVDLKGSELLAGFEAVGLAVGALDPRPFEIPGSTLPGVHSAMSYLTRQNRLVAGDADLDPTLDARGKHVIILGGGDTGSDCLGTALRQGAASVTQLELMPRPSDKRGDDNPWPEWPWIFRTSSSQEEGGDRAYGLMTTAIEGTTACEVLVARETTRTDTGGFTPSGDERRFRAELILIATGFQGAWKSPLYAELGVATNPQGRLDADARGRTSVSNVFAMGDARRGASLVVWAIAEGRHAAASIRDHLEKDRVSRAAPSLG